MSKLLFDTISNLFEYNDNKLWWKVRPSNRVDTTKPAGFIDASTGYRKISIQGTTYLFHRVIYLLHNPKWAFFDSSRDNQIDHRDGDTSNNVINNLRISTHSQNGANRGKNKNNKSGYKGVSRNEGNNKWVVKISANGRQIYLGTFECIEEAHRVYCNAANKYHGEFANHGK